MKPRDLALASAVSLVFALLLARPGAERLQGGSLDALYWLRDRLAPERHRPEDSPVVVVAIDEESHDTAPFKGVPRVLWTEEIADVLTAMVDADVAVVGLDIVLSTTVESRLAGADRALRRALREGANRNKIILGEFPAGPGVDRPMHPLPWYDLAVRGGCNVRSLTVFRDAAGVVRHVPLLFAAKQDAPCARDGFLPSMSLEIAARLTGEPWRLDSEGSVHLANYRVPARRDASLVAENGKHAVRNDMAVNFDRGPASVPTYPLVDLYRCAEAGNADYFREHFSGRAVLLGTVLDWEDRKLTGLRYTSRHGGPYRPKPCALDARREAPKFRAHQTIPGVYIQAAAVTSLVRGEALKELDRLPYTAVIAGFTLAVGILAMSVGSFGATVGFTVLTACWAITVFAAFIAGWVLPLFPSIAAGAGTFATMLGYRFAVTDRAERHIRQAFGHYLAPAIVDRLAEDGEMPEQGGVLRDMTVWISDLANYSTLSERLDAPEVVSFLNTVYTVMSDTVEEFDGFVAQFVGDAVVAAYGAPIEDPDHARKAVESAMACARRVASLGATMDLPDGMTLGLRIGISTGPLVVGNIGSKRRLSYSIVGDDINLASRLEGVNKLYGSTILAAESTRSLCPPDFRFREVDTVRVKGRDTPVTIYEPLGPADAIDEARNADLRAFADALAAYRDRRFGAARSAFQGLAGRDPVAEAWADRARDKEQSPPPADWDGVRTLLTK